MSNATIKQHQKEILLDTKGQYMKESNTLASYVANTFRRREIWIHTKGQYIKESNTFADNAKNISLQKEVWLNTKGEHMKEFRMLLYTYTIGLYQKKQ